MCQYPTRILPKPRYIKLVNVDELNERCKKSFLVRRLETTGNPFHIIGGRKLLNEGVIDEDVLDWSTNLLGGEFQVEDICWRQKGEGVSPWEEEEINIADFKNCYERIDLAFPIFIAIEKLHKIEIPYRRNFGSKADAIKYAEATQDLAEETLTRWTSDVEPECHATITIEHKPIRLNYWHMTIEITPHDFVEPIDRDSKKKKGLKERVKKALHLYIINNVQCECTELEQLPESIYNRKKIT